MEIAVKWRHTTWQRIPFGVGMAGSDGPRVAKRLVRNGLGPPGIDRIDKPKVKGEQWHAHHGPGQGSDAVNLDGSAKHGNNAWLTSEIKAFLRRYGWSV